ncbi:MAG: hypothetical protein AB8B68_00305 [Rickettsiaceae bacterium]
MNIYNKFNQTKLKLTIILAVTLALSACKEDQQEITTIQGEATYQAKVVKHEIHLDYLNCYPLSKDDKKQCVKILNKQYAKNHLSDSHYLQFFQYEAEKLGFKHFLNNADKNCEKVSYGPEFEPEKQAYLVKCKPDQQYFMTFNYQTKTWCLIDEK